MLATQTLIQSKAKNMRVVVDGALADGVTAKDIILAIIGQIGTAGGTGHVIEYAGEAIRALSMEGRMTVCNMSIEGGARAGMVAPDEKTYAYLKGRPKSPKGALWDQARRYWDTLRTDEGAHFDAEVRLDAADLPPIVSWGTSPQDVVAIAGFVPRVEDGATEAKRASIKRALEYMGLQGGEKIADIAIDRVFIGSCTNGRIEDLRAAAKIVEGRKVAERVNAMVVPGSGLVKAQAEAEGLDKIFTRRRLRMARAGLLDVPGDEPRQARARRALRLDLEPQFRGPPGLQGPHPSRLAGDGGGGGDRRAVRRREGVAVDARHESRRSPHRRERDRRKLRALVRAGRAERQQGRERGRVALRRAPLAEPAQRRRDPADQARRRARDAGRRDRHFRPALLEPAAQPRGRARAARGADRSRRSSAKSRAVRRGRRSPSKTRRLDEKSRRGAVKALRGKAGAD